MHLTLTLPLPRLLPLPLTCAVLSAFLSRSSRRGRCGNLLSNLQQSWANRVRVKVKVSVGGRVWVRVRASPVWFLEEAGTGIPVNLSL